MNKSVSLYIPGYVESFHAELELSVRSVKSVIYREKSDPDNIIVMAYGFRKQLIGGNSQQFH